jgi:hypothetical protein
MAQQRRTNGQTMFYKTLHIKLDCGTYKRNGTGMPESEGKTFRFNITFKMYFSKKGGIFYGHDFK